MAVEKDIGSGESLQVRTRAVVLVVLSILIVLSAIAFGLAIFLPDRIGIPVAHRRPFPAPAVIPDERLVRLSLEARQREELRGAAGRLPIEQGMKAIAARGSTAFDPVAQ